MSNTDALGEQAPQTPRGGADPVVAGAGDRRAESGQGVENAMLNWLFSPPAKRRRARWHAAGRLRAVTTSGAAALLVALIGTGAASAQVRGPVRALAANSPALRVTARAVLQRALHARAISTGGAGLPTSPTATYNGTSNNEELGWSVALSANGEVALVGAPNDAITGPVGFAYLYVESNGAWPTSPTATFVGTASNAGFGASVALSADGSSVLVGEPYSASVGPGAAYLYTEPTGGWPTGDISTSAATATFSGTGDDDLGSSVALSADGAVVLVGAGNANGGSGAAYLYTKATGSDWPTGDIPTSAATATFGGTGDGALGSSVALSADGAVALVGAPLVGNGAGQAGAAELFSEPTGGWSGTASPTVTFDGSNGEFLGTSVALSSDGSEALLGAPGMAINIAAPGAAELFSEPSGGWSTDTSPVATATFQGSGTDALGSAVALSGNGVSVLLSAPFSSGGGSALFYNEPAGGWPANPTSTQSFTVPASFLSDSVALSASGGAALIGDPGAGADNGAGSAFLYAAPAPVVTSIAPTSGPTAGGTSVTITGTNLSDATAVDFGTTAGSITADSATSITATSPAESAGSVDVTVTTPGGTSASAAGDRFAYAVPAPVVTSISPTSGPTAGGTSVTITGTNLAGATAVVFGTTAGSITADRATSITATSPAESAGTVDVTVTTPGGTSASAAGDRFAYSTTSPNSPNSPNSPSASTAYNCSGICIFVVGSKHSGAITVSGNTINLSNPTNVATTANTSTLSISATSTISSSGARRAIGRSWLVP
ncbi:MAG: IPT/TIG domain-containing protein [Actinomycetota bacterium]|nr:IPT/TIG domain-containing protein [Actinomycetota bacterium]